MRRRGVGRSVPKRRLPFRQRTLSESLRKRRRLFDDAVHWDALETQRYFVVLTRSRLCHLSGLCARDGAGRMGVRGWMTLSRATSFPGLASRAGSPLTNPLPMRDPIKPRWRYIGARRFLKTVPGICSPEKVQCYGHHRIITPGLGIALAGRASAACCDLCKPIPCAARLG